ncbi:hypothetical protein TNCV_3919001 [Trichonephila clavipes]|nr:hypothetical protein TNCV_3919001 [Trichonephila clavipes]
MDYFVSTIIAPDFLNTRWYPNTVTTLTPTHISEFGKLAVELISSCVGTVGSSKSVFLLCSLHLWTKLKDPVSVDANAKFVFWEVKLPGIVCQETGIRSKDIQISDEAHFWLNGYVNKQNCRIWSEANPQVYVETPLHPEKLTVWCALWAGGILLQKR